MNGSRYIDVLSCIGRWVANSILWWSRTAIGQWKPSSTNFGSSAVKRNGCGNFVPAGCYDRRHTNFACSGECWRRLRSEKNLQDGLVQCACGCGEYFQPWRTGGDRHFKNREHAGHFRTEEALKRCGTFLPIVREYLDGFARIHYADSSRGIALTSLVVFCEFLIEKQISTMDAVVPPTITEFLIWGRNNGRKQVAHSTSSLSTFFNWQIVEGRRVLGNPVVPSIHKIVRNTTESRPLSDDEVDHAWDLLGKRGDAMLRLAMAVGLESGLRISELSNIRLEDVDHVKQRIYVRLPTKTKKPRLVPFGERTRKYIDEWLDVRDRHCGHDHLFVNKFGGPATAQSLRLAFLKALTKLGKNYYNNNTTVNADGFEEWSTHRLRHTMSTNLVNGGADASAVMAIGGWSTSGPCVVTSPLIHPLHSTATRKR
jgi:integrase/recombinase XerC